jgi:serine/threonine protein kinase
MPLPFLLLLPLVPPAEEYDEKADIFSLGILFAEIIVRQSPGKEGFLERHPRDLFAVNHEGFEKVVPASCPPSFTNLVKCCTESSPESRPSAEEVRSPC